MFGASAATIATVASSAVSAGTAIAGAAGGGGGSKAAQQAAIRAGIEANQYLTDAGASAKNLVQPYADLGLSAAQQLAWGLGLDVPQKKFVAADAPKTLSGNSGDPLWDQLVNEAQAPHIAKYGVPVSALNRDQDANNFYNGIAQKYADAKNAELEAKGAFVGQGRQGSLLNYGLEDYKKDVGYTPMVNTLEELQATPGYQFQLEQGLQGVNRSAAARGGLLSGANLKAINDYAQGQASTGYQAAWDRAQQAYANAFTRNQQKFVNLQNILAGGQQAAGAQADYGMTTAARKAGVTADTANTMGSLALAQNQQQQNNMTGIGNALVKAIGTGNTAGAGQASNATGLMSLL